MKDELGRSQRKALGLPSVTTRALPLPATSHGEDPCDSSDEQVDKDLKANQSGRSKLVGL
jgi:hypothetical protein